MEYRVVYNNDPKSMAIIEAPSSRDAAIIFYLRRAPKSQCSVIVIAQNGSHTRFPTNELALELFPAGEAAHESARASLPPMPAPQPSVGAPRLRSLGQEEIRVVVTDIDMRFQSMIFFMVKWAFAAMPAIIIIFVILMIVITLGSALLGHK